MYSEGMLYHILAHTWQTLPPFQPRIPQVQVDSMTIEILARLQYPGSPSFPEIEQLSRSVSDAEMDLMDYKQHFLSLRDLMFDLEDRQSRLLLYRNVCKSYLTPIRRLPNELLIEIFLLCWNLDEDQPSLHDEIRSPFLPTMILKLGHVCKLWHSVSRATPQLWTHFFLNLNCSFWRLESGFNLLKLHLLLSKQLSLSFGVLFDKGLFSTSEQVAPSMRLLIEHCVRWGDVVMQIENITGIQETRSLLSLKRKLPNLRTLRLIDTSDTLQPITNQTELLGIFGGVTSRLQMVTLDGFKVVPANLHLVKVQHLQMTKIRIDYPPADFVRSLLAGCSELRSLHLQIQSSSLNNQVIPRSIRLGKLKDLCLSLTTWEQLDSVLSVLILPVLHKITLYGIFTGQATMDGTFPSLASNLTCPRLSVLELIDLDSPTDLHALLRSTPNLTELQFHSSHWDRWVVPALIQAMHVPSAVCPFPSEIILPNLQKLELKLNGRFDAIALTNMIESRSSSGRQPRVRCLESVKLALPRESLWNHLIRRLQLLKNAGMSVEIVNTVRY
ncbi:hypothetical protein VKT23_010290 [Stygiomarasmius scandens]|uniref:F-box domain-containing protein n=1 Tax=Marasmiellus scandens TaxID=2682957 RepID=A0ABR1JBV7_9AGAR